MQTITLTNLSNREFLETHSLAGCIGLAGGRGGFLNKRSLAAQRRCVDPLKQWSLWSHAFIFQGRRSDGRHWVIESDLQVLSKHIQLGVQENRIDKLFDEAEYGTLAVMDFGLSPEQVQRLLSEALDLVSARTRLLDARKWSARSSLLKHPSLRGKPNTLARDRSFYCSAFVRHLFIKAGIDLTPGLDIKNTTPEDLWRSQTPHTTYLLQREQPKKSSSPIAKLKARVRKRLKKRKI